MSTLKTWRLLFAFCLLTTAFLLPLYGQRWGPSVTLGGGWNNQDMVFDSSGNSYLIWAGAVFTWSGDNGLTWSTPRQVVPSPNGQIGNPDLAIDQSNSLYAVFEYKITGATVHQVYFVKSTDLGATWTTPVRIGYTAKFSGWPKIEVDALDRIHVIWHDKCNLHNWSEPPLPDCAGADFYHLLSDDGGATWTQRLIVSGSDAWTIHTAVDSAGGIYGFWSFSPGPGFAGGVYMYRSLDGGGTWSSQYIGSGNENAASIDREGSVHVVYASRTSPTHFTLHYRRGENGGGTWSAPIVLAEEESGNSGYNPSAWCTIATDPKNNVLLAYQSGSSGNFEIYVGRSSNGGKTWQKVENLSNSSFFSLQPDLFIDSGSTVHSVWTEVTPDFYITYRRGPLRGK